MADGDETPDPDTAGGSDDRLDVESGPGQSDRSASQLELTQARACRPSKGASSKQLERYCCLKYEGNNSKRWDGREILVDKAYLESLYTDDHELQPGQLVKLPWTGKGGRVSSWKARIVAESTSAKAIESTLKGYNIFCWIAIIIYLYIGKGKGKVVAKGMHTV